MESLRLLILSALVILSLGQRRTGVGSIGELSRRSRVGESRPPLSQESPSSSTQEAEYVYEYYDEPDYQHYPPRPPHLHHHSLLDALQARRVNNGNVNLPSLSNAARTNALANNRERFTLSTSTKRPADLHAQISRIIPGISQETSSTEAPAEEEYEYVYEEGAEEEEAPPRNEDIETKVSVSVSASQHPSTPAPRSLGPESGIVISVATTRSVSSRLNPTPPTPQVAVTIPSSFVALAFPPASPVVSAQTASAPNLTAMSSLTLPTENDSSSSSARESKFVIKPKLVPLNEVATQAPPSSTTSSADGIKFEDVSKFLPANYKKPPSTQSLIPKIKFQEVLSQNFLPKGYVFSTASPVTVSTTTTSTPSTTIKTTTTSAPSTSTVAPPTQAPLPIDPLQALMNKIRFEEDISLLLPTGYKGKSLLPPDYKLPSNEASSTPAPPTSSTATPIVSASTTTVPSPGKVVFPTRPGGFKAVRPTVSEPPKAETPAPPKVALKSGWPTRKTTEFTGWPTVSTTPLPSPVTSSTTTTQTTSTEPPTTTQRTTTTLAPPKRSPVTICESPICKMEATLRITGGIRWKPEYADINTEEWKHLENTVKRELDGAYRSSGLAPFYRSIEIEAFNEGSVVVDYFLLLDNVDREISSEQIRTLFHSALLQGDESFDKNRLRLGRYTIDPRFTDFKARTFESESVTGDLEEALIPQWGIAVIVISLASLLFVIIFAVTLMVSKQRKSGKKSGVSLTQEMLNEFNKRSLGSQESSVRHREDLYNMDDAWDESHLERTLDLHSGSGPRSSLSKEGYNIYDSWKTEWQGYDHHFGKDSSTRRRSDYDTNF